MIPLIFDCRLSTQECLLPKSVGGKIDVKCTSLRALRWLYWFYIEYKRKKGKEYSRIMSWCVDWVTILCWKYKIKDKLHACVTIPNYLDNWIGISRLMPLWPLNKPIFTHLKMHSLFLCFWSWGWPWTLKKNQSFNPRIDQLCLPSALIKNGPFPKGDKNIIVEHHKNGNLGDSFNEIAVTFWCYVVLFVVFKWAFREVTSSYLPRMQSIKHVK